MSRSLVSFVTIVLMYKNRIRTLQELLREEEIDALLITNHSNIFYLTGISAFSEKERDARILLTQNSIYLFTSMLYSEMVKKRASHVSLVELSYQQPFTKSLLEILKENSVRALCFEKNNLLFYEYESLSVSLSKSAKLLATQDFVESVRTIKDPSEQKYIQNACNLTDKAFDFIVRHVKSGVSEKELAFKIDTFIRENGEDIAFPTIVAFGENSAIPHHHPTDYRLSEKDVFVLFDFGAKVGEYCSDMSRTVFFGKVSDHHKKMYDTTATAQRKGLEVLSGYTRNGFRSTDIQNQANAIITTQGFPEIPHSIGHGVGIDVHESPSLSLYSEADLEEGMVVTVEPGIYIPDFGGIRIEDTVLLKKDGIEILTKSPKDFIAL